MTRSPLFYPLNRGMDADAGGAADLQTDVMRFMAILSLCLVAIFALVQSLPLAPVTQEITAAPVASGAAIEVMAPAKTPAPIEASAPSPLSLTRPAPTTLPAREVPVPLERPRPQLSASDERPIREPAQSGAAVASPAPAAPPAEPRQGFTLRFESDTVLTRLVARDVVGLYAMAAQGAQRLSVNRGEVSFWPAAAPNRFHEMEAGTVPAPVIDAWRRRGSAPASTIKWGVTLPPQMAEQLNRILANHRGGSLIIGADGDLRLEP